MRRLLAILMVIVLAAAVGGCSSNADDLLVDPAASTGSAPAATQEAAPTDAAQTAAAGTSTENRSANDSELPPALFPSFATTETPPVFQERLDAGRPMIIFFYDDAQYITADIRKDIDAVMDSYRGLIDLLVFDLGGPTSDPAVQSGAVYAKELSVGVTPYILIVDRGGYITWRSKGYAERGIISREVERATR